MVKPTTRLGYTLGLQRDTRPYERPGTTNEEKFQSLVGDMGAVYAMGRQPQQQSPGKGQRKAGDGLNLYLRQTFGTGKFAPLPPLSSGPINEPTSEEESV
jgi:hypothetical protein